MNLSNFGDHLLHCDIDVFKRINEGENASVQVNLCALLNSGGGILHLSNNVTSNDEVNSKLLDTWWSGIEQQIRWLISQDDVCNYIDLFGKFDSKDLYIFVKSSDHVCTISYHARVPTDTATLSVNYHTILKLFEKKSHEIGILTELPAHPEHFCYGQPLENFRQETSQIQFKYLSNEKDPSHQPLAQRISWFIRRYISAFANHRGGYILFGIEDKSCLVFGEDVPDEDTKGNIISQVNDRMMKSVWKMPNICVQRGIHWDIVFYPVHNVPEGTPKSRFVIIVSVVRYPGLVYTQLPESYYIVDGQVQQMSFNEWRRRILLQSVGIDELKYKYHRLINVHSSRLLPIYMIQDFITSIKEKYFTVSEGTLLVYPRQPDLTRLSNKLHVGLEWLTNIATKISLTGIALIVNLTDLCLTVPIATKPAECLCDILLITTVGIFLITLIEGPAFAASEDYNIRLGKMLKNRLVMDGGCMEKFNIMCHVITHTQYAELPKLSVAVPEYQLNRHKLEYVLHALVVTLATFPPIFSEFQHKDEFLLTLSEQQFELLWQHQQYKELWVHGPPGTGKTVAAVEFIKQLLRRGCSTDEILYICEHQPLCEKIRSLQICKAVSRRYFLANADDNTEKNTNKYYDKVKNIIFDEVQNFKDRDGDWYSLAEKIIKTGDNGRDCHGYLWAFVDTSIQVHKFRTGIPDLTNKMTFELTKVLRSSKEICGFASKYFNSNDETDSGQLGCVNQYPGREVQFISCHSDCIKDVLPQLIEQYANQGYQAKDVAVLFSKRREAETWQGLSSNAHINTVKHFSGLDKPIVIGVHPKVNPVTADFNKFMLNLASRASSELVIISADESDNSKLLTQTDCKQMQ
ncbi:schlafen family member 11-like isoform X2 [Ptychodera flava]|uniref:schlafen family member 11-like isoform X2 n=1 Tax=Ptychodera flava TaxID=63121 RepID=UPI003969E109